MLVTSIFSFSHNVFNFFFFFPHYVVNDKIILTQKFKFALGRVENIAGERKNVGYQHFLLFPQCFQFLSFFFSFPHCVVNDKIILTQKFKFALGRVENIAGGKRKCWIPPFSPFPTMFSVSFFFSFPHCVVKCLGSNIFSLGLKVVIICSSNLNFSQTTNFRLVQTE